MPTQILVAKNHIKKTIKLWRLKWFQHSLFIHECGFMSKLHLPHSKIQMCISITLSSKFKCRLLVTIFLKHQRWSFWKRCWRLNNWVDKKVVSNETKNLYLWKYQKSKNTGLSGLMRWKMKIKEKSFFNSQWFLLNICLYWAYDVPHIAD